MDVAMVLVVWRSVGASSEVAAAASGWVEAPLETPSELAAIPATATVPAATATASHGWHTRITMKRVTRVARVAGRFPVRRPVVPVPVVASVVAAPFPVPVPVPPVVRPFP